MKSELVASHFRNLTRSLATALDVLPLNQIEICDEVKEVMELVSKQARKSKMELEPHDELATKRVNSVLLCFERGIEPNLNSVKRILDYLEIKNWNYCNKEIKFLEDENIFNDEREVPLLSSLLGFLCYCRVVIFETLDFQDAAVVATATPPEMINCINPEDFRCPISLELMTDPVTISTGHTYDRASIQKWLKAGNRTCPKTGEKLTNTELVPNTTLKNLIRQFCADTGVSVAKFSHRSRDITRTAVAGSTASAHAVQFLSWFIARRLVFGTNEQKNKAAYEIRLLARSNIFNRACLIQVGTVTPLLNLLETTNDDDDNKSTQENAISAILKLAKHIDGQEAIMENGGLTPIVTILKKGVSIEARQIAAATIFYLSSTEQHRKTIGQNPDAIPGLVQLMKEGRTSFGIKNAVVAIFGLLLLPQNHRKVIEAKAIPALLRILSGSQKPELLTDCLAVLAALVENVEGANAIMVSSSQEEEGGGSGLGIISGMLLRYSSLSTTCRVGKEHCVSILVSLCVNVGDEVVSDLAKDSSVMPCLYSIITDGTPHAAKKARSLIKMVQEFNENRAPRWVGNSSVAPESSLRVR